MTYIRYTFPPQDSYNISPVSYTNQPVSHASEISYQSNSSNNIDLNYLSTIFLSREEFNNKYQELIIQLNNIYNKYKSLESSINSISEKLDKTNSLIVNHITTEYNQLKQIIDQLPKTITEQIKSNIEKLDLPKIKIIESNRDPTINDRDYPNGSIWINTKTGIYYLLIDNQLPRWVSNTGITIEPTAYYITDIFGDNSIIAFYRFDNNTLDDTGVYNGKITGDIRYVKGIHDYAIDFGQIPNNINSFQVKDIELNDNMTFSFWIYKHTTNQLTPYISLAYENKYNGILLFEHNEKLKMIINDYRIYEFPNFRDVLPEKQWIHITLSISSKLKQAQIYLNGELLDILLFKDAPDFSYKDYSYNNCLVFGQDQDTYCSGFQETQSYLGILDHFRIFNRMLLPHEIYQLYTEQPTRI